MPGSKHTDSTAHRLALSSALREARRAAALTQAQMARRIGLSPAFYGRLERAEALPNVATLAQIARALGISADVLIGTAASRGRSGRRSGRPDGPGRARRSQSTAAALAGGDPAAVERPGRAGRSPSRRKRGEPRNRR